MLEEKDGCILLKQKYKDNKKRDENNYIRRLLTQFRDYLFYHLGIK